MRGPIDTLVPRISGFSRQIGSISGHPLASAIPFNANTPRSVRIVAAMLSHLSSPWFTVSGQSLPNGCLPFGNKFSNRSQGSNGQSGRQRERGELAGDVPPAQRPGPLGVDVVVSDVTGAWSPRSFEGRPFSDLDDLNRQLAHNK